KVTDIHRRAERFDLLSVRFITDADGGWTVQPGLLDELLDLPVCAEGGDTIGRAEVAYDFQRVASDGTGRTENCDTFVHAAQTIARRRDPKKRLNASRLATPLAAGVAGRRATPACAV